MGEAKRRKKLGLYPEQTTKPPKKARGTVVGFGGYRGREMALLLSMLAGYPKLPEDKPSCFGNHCYEPCGGRHHTCPVADDCRRHTNKTKGECDCEYKEHCHTPRQHAASWNGGTKHECTFYPMFEEDAKSIRKDVE